jgi:hypothetical protein
MVASVLILLTDFQISNDGRSFLSAAESLRSGNGYISLGRCGDLKNPSYLVDWPPIYSVIISLFSKAFDLPVFIISKYYHFFIFLFFSTLLWFCFKNILTAIQLVILVLIIFNSEHYFITNSEVMFLPIVLMVYLNRSYFLDKPVFFGSVVALLYLIKYSFLFFIPFGLFYIIINIIGSEFGPMRFKLIKGLLSYIFGFLLIFMTWHLLVYYETGHFWPRFIGAEKPVESAQYFLDFSITWNLIPERFERIPIVLVSSFILWLGVVLYAVKVLFKNVNLKLKKDFMNDYGGLYFSLLFLAMLSFYFLESYLHFNSTKRYLEDSQFLFVFMLFVERNRYLIGLNKNKINEFFYKKIYWIIILSFIVTQSAFSVLKTKNIFEIKMDTNTETMDPFVLGQLMDKEFDIKSGKIFVTDKDLVSSLLKFKYWDRIVEIDDVMIWNLDVMGVNDVLVVQKRDNKNRLFKQSNKVFILDR